MMKAILAFCIVGKRILAAVAILAARLPLQAKFTCTVLHLEMLLPISNEGS